MNLVIRKGRHGILRPGHPWVYRQQLLKAPSPVKPGSIVSVYYSDGKLIGTGYYNPRSEIAVRLLSFKDEPIDKKFFFDRIRAACDRRRQLLSRTNAYRAIFSEADGLPGLIADLYNDTVVFQVLTLGMEKFKEIIVAGINSVIHPKYIYEKSVSPFRKIEGLKDAAGWHGAQGSPEIEIAEGKVKFLVNIEHGHKTGFYLDQRNSRMALQNISKGKSVLDLFCYTGAFSVSAAVYGAKRVCGVDIKDEWLSFARKNAELNGVREKAEFIKAEAFEFLKEKYASGDKFDIIIVDPPSFLRTRQSIVTASKGYRQLNLLAMKTLSPAGVLATFSCSHNMPNEAFSAILKEAAVEAGKRLTILKRCHQAEDHPIVRAIPETEYLKGYFLKVETA